MTSKIVWSKQFNIKSIINNKQIKYEIYYIKPSEFMLLENKSIYNYDKYKNLDNLYKYNLIDNNYKLFEYGRMLLYNYL